ncbi:unnamed protein product [Fraxinus pennsylvanica]|uniref:Uncharacterized protein n=1 Tax=Fraxinus pennsylvanica TaxID=56036 RepID=A0AAD1ZHV8_9LAMI|nr:unnamed protein product [Fraxinus pennsylvanica]
MEGDSEPVMYPDRPAFSKIGSSDSPRREMSATRLVSGSQLMPYQLLQQSVPDHVLNMPKYGSLSAALNATNADRSAGGQALTVKVMASSTVSLTKKSLVSFMFVFYIMYMKM